MYDRYHNRQIQSSFYFVGQIFISIRTILEPILMSLLGSGQKNVKKISI